MKKYLTSKAVLFYLQKLGLIHEDIQYCTNIAGFMYLLVWPLPAVCAFVTSVTHQLAEAFLADLTGIWLLSAVYALVLNQHEQTVEPLVANLNQSNTCM